MLARRMLMFVAILLAVTALTAGLAPPPRPAAPTPRPAGAPAATSSGVVERTLDADRRRISKIVVEHGDILRLTVTGSEPDAVELRGLATLQALTPETPVVFDVLVDAPGVYPVVLLQAARTIATVRVIARKE